MDTNTADHTVAQRVTAAMQAGGYSQKATAEASGIPRVTLIRRLSGATPFTVKELASIADVLGCDIRDFFEDAA